MSTSDRMRDVARATSRTPEGRVFRILRKALMDHPDTRASRGTFAHSVDMLVEAGLMPLYEHWCVEANAPGGGREVHPVPDEQAALDMKAELRKSRRAPIIQRWYTTERAGVIYDEHDRDLIERHHS